VQSISAIEITITKAQTEKNANYELELIIKNIKACHMAIKFMASVKHSSKFKA